MTDSTTGQAAMYMVKILLRLFHSGPLKKDRSGGSPGKKMGR